MSQFIRIVRSWDDHEPVILGLVRTEKTLSKAIEEIDHLWSLFKEQQSNTDTDFVSLLVKHGYVETRDPWTDVVLG